MLKCYVRHSSADDVGVFLRDEEARDLLVLAPVGDPPWVGIVGSHDVELEARASRLAARFGQALLTAADDRGWTLRLLRADAEPVAVVSSGVSKDDSRKVAQSIAQAMGTPRITTALARVLARPLAGAAALERVGEALALTCCGRTRDEIAADERVKKLRVDGARIVGKLSGPGAGPGYAHVSGLIEDTVVDLLVRGRYEAALTQLRAYDIALSAEDGGMRCRAPQGMVTPALREAMARHKDELIQRL